MRRPFALPPPPGKEQPGAVRPPPGNFKVRYGVTFGVESGMAYEVDHTGKLAATWELLPQSFHKEIPPPPGARK
jgi:hypothetical protein